MSFVSPFAVLGFLVNLSAAAAFFVAVFVYGKRIGGAGPWLVAAAAGLDAGMIVLFRLAMLGAGARPYYEVEHTLAMLRLLDSFVMLVAAGLALAGLGLIMNRRLETP